MRRLGNWVAATLLVALLVVLVASNVRTAILNYSEPFKFLGASTDTPVLRAGEKLRLLYTFDRSRYCNTDVNWFIARQSDNEIVYRERVVGGATMIGKATVINALQLPTSIQPGAYVVHIITFSTCSDGPHPIAGPDIFFRVIE